MERFRSGTETAAYCSNPQSLAPLPPPPGHTRFVWSHMSEADRVFARMTTPGTLPSPEDKQFLHVTSRRRGAAAGQNRVVEVVHRRSGHKAPAVDPAPAASWPEGFQGRSTPPLPSVEDPAASPVPALPVAHLMPGWKPLLAPLQPPAKVPMDNCTQRRAAKLERSKTPPKLTRRAFADPFVVDDTGTNCIRCGYLVSPAREKRGLMTCMQCR